MSAAPSPVPPRRIRRSPVRSPFRVAAYVAATAVAAFGIVAFSFGWFSGSGTSAGSLTNGVRLSSITRDRFQELYELGWRGDGNAGNTEVEAVFYYPALVTSLEEYAERSLVQGQTLQALQPDRAADRYSFLIQLNHNEAFPPAVKLESILSLVGNRSVSYTLDRIETLTSPEGSQGTVIAVARFKRPAGASEPDTLQLTVNNLPGNTRPTVFTWNSALLR